MKPKTAITEAITSMGTMLNYIKSPDGWHPKMYSHCIELVHNNIMRLRKIIQDLEQENNPVEELIQFAIETLQNYSELQDLYYS